MAWGGSQGLETEVGLGGGSGALNRKRVIGGKSGFEERRGC